MKKKGFTLVELLAVIAILAILVIIALPNVMNLFNRAKENAFETEIKEIYKTAQQQWIADSMLQTQSKVYCNVGGGEALEMSGRSELQYSIKFNKSGEVVAYEVSDGSYQYEFDNSANPLEIDKINAEGSTEKVQQVSKLEESDVLTVECHTAD